MRSQFKCSGCGKLVKVDSRKPKFRSFVWTDIKTKKKKPYCYDCDGKLIEGVPLPNERWTTGKMVGPFF